jgi:phage FluMu gp28-like protein
MVRFDPSQMRFFLDESRVIVVVWHRQKGKDFTAAGKAVDHAMRTGQDWFIVSLTQRQADATFAKCRKHFEAFKHDFKLQGEALVGEGWEFTDYDAEIEQAFKATARVLILPNGARVVSLPGRDPDTLAGLTGNVIFTEFGLFPNGGYAHWRVVFPLATRGYMVIVISTPRGKNHKFFELVSDPQTYSVHFCDIYKSIAEDGFVLRDNAGRPTDLETFKRLYGDPVGFEREYGCQFTGDLLSLITWAQLVEAGELTTNLPFTFLRVERGGGWVENFFRVETPAGGRFEIGWDVARTGHLSALWVNHRRPGQPTYLRFLVLMHQTDFATQRHIVRAAMDARGFGSAVGCGDATGLGMDSNETLSTLYRDRWEGVNFASKKGELGSTALAAYRDRTQAIPPADGAHKFIAADLYAVQRVTGEEAESEGGQGMGGGDQEKGRKLKLAETPNPMLPESHCDIAYANFLALRAGARNPRMPLPAAQVRKPLGW